MRRQLAALALLATLLSSTSATLGDRAWEQELKKFRQLAGRSVVSAKVVRRQKYTTAGGKNQ